MKTIEIQGSSGISTILIGERMANLPLYAPEEKMVIVSDENVYRRYGHDFPKVPVIQIGTGEKNKTLETVSSVFERLIDLEVDRGGFIVGIGGGLVCDLAGFVASTYLRGLSFGFLASTLLAQVDASVGGKNGVNFGGYKNMIGVFNQPRFVICDLELLATLSNQDVGCGLAEIVKHAAIADPDMFSFLETKTDQILNLEASSIERLIYDSVVIKSSIVNRDEKEADERRKLNFGHTFGHAVEKVTGVPHGQAVSQGMAVAADLSVKRGLLSADEQRRIEGLLRQLDLPVRLQTRPDRLLEALGKDKKRQGDLIHFVLLKGIGQAVVEPIPLQEIRETAAQLAW